MPTGRNIPSAPPGALAQAIAASQDAVGSLPPYTLLAQKRQRLTSQEGTSGTGVASVSLQPPAGSNAYLVGIIHVSSDSTTASAVSVQVDGDEVDFTAAGNQDVAYEQPPIWVGAGSVISVNWSNLSTKAQVTASLQYQVVSAP